MQFRLRVASLVAAGGLAACAVIAKLDAVDSIDGGPTADDGGDGRTQNPTTDGAATVVDAGTDGSDTGATPVDSGPGFLCPPTDTTVTDCSACAGYPLACQLCGGSGPRMVCTRGRVCNQSQIVSHWCPCSGTDAAACPFERQTCYPNINGGICLTCGEQNSTNGYACNNGKTCSATSYTCQ